MIRYVKRRAPGNLVMLAATPGADWDSLGASDKGPLRETLVADQSWLCAYCQRRITTALNPNTGLPLMKIEHWQARAGDDSRPLVWRHLLGVCHGVSSARGGNAEQHCDTHRGSRPLFLHPVEGEGQIHARISRTRKVARSSRPKRTNAWRMTSTR